ncbi:MAG: cell division protein SepF [Hydrogenibacillus sp.]|nr:cell division protein SepF [Hydrogenibacillus sp.]
MMQKVLTYLGLSDEREVLEDTESAQVVETPEEPRRAGRRPNIVALDDARAKAQQKVVLIEPRSFNEVKEMADHLRARRTVIVNLHRIRPEHLQRMKDFLSGAVYVLDGVISRLGEDVYLLAPDQVDVQGAIASWEEQERDDA